VSVVKKTAESIKLMLGRVHSGNIYYVGVQISHGSRNFLGGGENWEAQSSIQGECGVGHAKMAELIKLPFGTMSQLCPRHHIIDGRAQWRHLANTVALSRSATGVVM